MRRRILIHTAFSTLFFLTMACVAVAQENNHAEQAADDSLGPWKIANTLLFAIALGFFIYKSAPGFFNARSADIQRAIQEATGLKMDADLRYSEIDRKMATLADELKKIRGQANVEMEREHYRLRQETQQGVQRLQHNVAAEIEALRLEAIHQVRRQTAREALALAERKLQTTLAATASDNLLRDFVQLVERGKN